MLIIGLQVCFAWLIFVIGVARNFVWGAGGKCTVLPQGASEVDQTYKFDDFFRSFTVLSYLIGQYFDRNKLCQQCYLQQL